MRDCKTKCIKMFIVKGLFVLVFSQRIIYNSYFFSLKEIQLSLGEIKAKPIEKTKAQLKISSSASANETTHKAISLI